MPMRTEVSAAPSHGPTQSARGPVPTTPNTLSVVPSKFDKEVQRLTASICESIMQKYD